MRNPAATIAWLTRTLSLCLLVGAVGCGNKQRLPQYEFRGHTLAVTTLAPSHPEVLGRVSYRIDPEQPLESLLRVGSSAAFEATAHQARPRLDSAAVAVNVNARIGERVLDGAARHLRALPVASAAAADYEIEIRVRRYGIVATSWSAPARFLIDADLFLLDGRTGRRIWQSQVRASSPIRPVIASGDRSVDNAISALTLANMSTGEIQQHLERLADFSADRLLARLIRSLDQARG